MRQTTALAPQAFIYFPKLLDASLYEGAWALIRGGAYIIVSILNVIHNYEIL